MTRRLCLVCGRITSGSYCRVHQPKPRVPRRQIPRTVKDLVIARGGHMCQIRLRGCTGKATVVDHVIPLARGGTDDPENLQGSCKSCNRAKGDSLLN